MKKFLAASALALAGFSGQAHAADAPVLAPDEWFLKVGVSGVIFDSSLSSTNQTRLISGASVTNNITGTIEAGRYLTDGFAIAVAAGIPPTNDLHATILGTDTLIGSATYGSLMALAQYHFNRGGQISPYLGAGIAYNVTFATSPNFPVTSLSIDNGFAPVLQAGVDFKVADHISLFADVKKEFYTAHASTIGGLPPTSNYVRLDPWIVTAGVGFSF